MSRDRIIEIALSSIALILGGLLLYRELDVHEEPPSHPIATALMQEQGEAIAWPPPSVDAEGVLRDTVALEAIERSGDRDAGLDAGERDAGPLLPELPPDTPSFRAREGQQDGIYYLEVVIGDAALDDPLPMVVVLHGRGGRAEVPGGPFLGLTHPVRVIVPQAPDRLGSGFEWLPVYVGQGLVDRLSSTLFAQASRVANVVRSLANERPTVGRVIATGFSQGGLLTMTLALYHDDLIGEAFPLSCWLPPPLEPVYMRADLDYPRIRSMHGTADTTIPFEPTRSLFSRLAAIGFDVALHPFPGVTHTISDDENALFHLWLEAAVCRAVDDAVCADDAERTAATIAPSETELLDAGPDDAGVDDAGADDAGDAGADAGT
jgi:phospholipase/carboxylesterase